MTRRARPPAASAATRSTCVGGEGSAQRVGRARGVGLRCSGGAGLG